MAGRKTVADHTRDKASDYMGQQYTLNIRFGRGKCRDRWRNAYEFFKHIFKFTNRFLMNDGERKELNALDMRLIKYKPPD